MALPNHYRPEDAQRFPEGSREWDEHNRAREDAGLASLGNDAAMPAAKPVASAVPAPASLLPSLPAEDLKQIPPPEAEMPEDDYEQFAPTPPPTLSKGAIYKRLNRAMKPREDGSFILPESIRLDWADKEKRPEVFRLFERCAWEVSHKSEEQQVLL